MKLLITGSSGMTGRSLIKKLKKIKDLQLLTPSRQELDLLNQNAVNDYFKTHQPEFVIHLAAQVGGIQANISNQIKFLTENTLINTHVIMGALNQNITKLLFFGSSCMYPKDRTLLSESDLLTGILEPTNEGYALSKINNN